MSAESEFYPAVGTDHSYSVLQWHHQRNHLKGASQSYYLCGRLLQTENKRGFRLWTQQAEVVFDTTPEFEWINHKGEWGDWVALLIDSNVIGNIEADLVSILAPVVKVKLLVRQNGEPKMGGTIENLRLRTQFVDTLRESLKALRLEEIETPFLVPCPGMEPTLEPFVTHWHWGQQTQTLYLPTSPELHLKKLIAQGWTDLFELKTCFRNSELTDHHEPEFLMLEWYRAFKNLNQIKADLAQLLDAFFEKGFIKGSRPKIEETTFTELFQEFVKATLTPETTREELLEVCQSHSLATSRDDTFDDLFFRLTLEFIEPKLKDLGPLVISGFPPSQAALARLTEAGWADRFEFYWRGLEIANAFHELNDPEEQARRFQNEIALRKRYGTTELKPDMEFLQALQVGMPPAAGVALGVERLLMACQNETVLTKYRAFKFSPQTY